ncbi:hypothetical protein D3H65_12100 [Paraflavitalea soli]|uniref:Uncharacterized protein n=1 Tax=Paraflavitalea soli TaxID=2315862 RepID=A0A3B7MKH7_9BACT|nr:hypothetical protein [Paraflavitalea soli]AXY74678.1 hypothetical protein D3H65_12100 [Paraflavitalea soli]
MENKNIPDILDRLADILQQNDSLPLTYLDSMQERDQVTGSTLPAGQLRRREEKLPEFLQQLGIRSMTLHDPANIETLLSTASNMAAQIGGTPHHYFHHSSFAGYFQTIFQQATTIGFADWSLFANASDYWDKLLTAVIKPLKTKELQFIFYLGNISSRPVFMVDEMLDIMGDFARYGQVTFIMDQQEMKKLWEALNGVNTARNDLWPFDIEERYKSLFNTMNVHKLVVYALNGVSLYSRKEQFNLTRRVMTVPVENAPNGRNNFINGYSLGLSLQLESALCIILGIIYYELITQHNISPSRHALLNHIKSWKDQQGVTTAQTPNL